MDKANEALADVRGWLCDNLSEGDAGKVCGMLSSVSRQINELEAENDELKKAMDFQALELGCMTDNRDVLYVENKNLRELVLHTVECVRRLNDTSENGGCVLCPYQLIDYDCDFESRMRELGIEVKS